MGPWGSLVNPCGFGRAFSLAGKENPREKKPANRSKTAIDSGSNPGGPISILFLKQTWPHPYYC